MSVLKKVRSEISASPGSNEFDVTRSNDQMQDLFDSIQKLKIEMNEAKKQAAAKAAEPFLAQINQLEQDYALILKLSA